MWILDHCIWEDIGIWDDTDFWCDSPVVAPITANLDALEAGDTLVSVAAIPVITIIGGLSRPGLLKFLPTIYADLDVTERADTCISTATLGPNPVELDNNLLLLAA